MLSHDGWEVMFNFNVATNDILLGDKSWVKSVRKGEKHQHIKSIIGELGMKDRMNAFDAMSESAKPVLLVVFINPYSNTVPVSNIDLLVSEGLHTALYPSGETLGLHRILGLYPNIVGPRDPLITCSYPHMIIKLMT